MAEHPPGSTADLRGSDDPDYAANLKRATLASSMGSALEYYDFALYGLASALIFGQLFFPALGAPRARWPVSPPTPSGSSPARSAASSSARWATGSAARLLMITIAFMGGASTLIGVLPTGAQVGIWAPIMLVLLRSARDSAPAPSRPEPPY